MEDAVVAAGNVIVTFEPSAYVIDVVVEPSLLVVDVLDAPCSACSSGSELDPVALEPLDPSDSAT